MYTISSARVQRARRYLTPSKSSSVSSGFDATTHPIIARHWFGIEPFRPIGQTVTAATTFRRQRQIEHVYRLGLRAVGELLFEVAEGEDLDRALEAYQRLTPDLLKAVGGDHFPPLPIHEVRP